MPRIKPWKSKKKRKVSPKREKRDLDKRVVDAVGERLVLTDEAWEQIEAILKKLKGTGGSPPELSDRMFIEAILYVARTGIPWRDLPKCFGNWEAVYKRFRRWESNVIWKGLWEELQQEKFKTARIIFIDSTIVRAHQHAAGAQKKMADRKPRVLVALAEDSRPKSMPPAQMNKQVYHL